MLARSSDWSDTDRGPLNVLGQVLPETAVNCSVGDVSFD